MTLYTNDHHIIFATMPKKILLQDSNHDSLSSVVLNSFYLYLIFQLIICQNAMKNKFHLKVMCDTTCHSFKSNPEHNPDFLLRRFLQFDSRR